MCSHCPLGEEMHVGAAHCHVCFKGSGISSRGLLILGKGERTPISWLGVLGASPSSITSHTDPPPNLSQLPECFLRIAGCGVDEQALRQDWNITLSVHCCSASRTIRCVIINKELLMPHSGMRAENIKQTWQSAWWEKKENNQQIRYDIISECQLL